MRKLVLGFLLITTSVLGQEVDKSIAILAGPTNMWTRNRLKMKDEYNSFNHLGLQFTHQKSTNLAITITTLASFQGDYSEPGIWNNKHITLGGNLRYFILPKTTSSTWNPFVHVGADASARRDVGFPGNAYELNAAGGLGIDIRLSSKFSLLAQTNLAVPVAQSTEAGIKIVTIRGTNNSTSFGIVYHLGDKVGKKKEEQKAKALEEDARLKAAAKEKEEAMAKAAAEAKVAREAAEKAAAQAAAQLAADAAAAKLQQEKAAAEAAVVAANELAQAKQKAEQYTISSQTIILYLTNKWELVAESIKKLQPMLSILTEHPELKIQIDGHSDNFGTAENNQLVSKYRAEGVMDYFKKQGIKSNRLKLKAYGENKPTASNQTKAGMALNRRVEIRVIK
ncbi:MAG: outer membrane protein [Bacteroidota bacterium]|jgi:outer membrane protein OmpA-like peptidoglycan-associated protein